MGATSVRRRRARRATPSGSARAIDAASAAWLAAIPCAIVVAAAIAVLGPPLADLLRPAPGSFHFLPDSLPGVYDESHEHAAYLIALAGPLLLALATVVVLRRQPASLRDAAGWAVPAAQLGLLALLVACFVVQYRTAYGAIYTRMEGATIRERYFNPATLVAAFAVAAGLLLAVRSAPLRARAGALLRESTLRRRVALAVAAALTVVWLLHAVNTDESIASVLWPVRYHLEYTLDETFAVVNGLTPLVDFSSQYSALWPFLGALTLGIAGKTLLAFTVLMCALTAVALLAVYGVLRRATRSAAVALALYAPFLATSLFSIGPADVNRGSFANYFGIFPLRYAGPYLVAWLAARHLDRSGRGRSAWLLFAAAGLTLLNNVDFGAAALGASVAALLWGAPPRTRGALLRLLGALAGGLLTAVALVCALTLARAGSLPHPARLIDYARVYGQGGFNMLPMPGPLGLHTAIYLTYVAAIGVATVRALRGAGNKVLTGMLAWAGIFGLGAASYYVGRSQPEALRTTFSTWALALALLTYLAVRELAAHPRRRPSVAVATVLVGFGIAVCSVVQVPLPWQQIDRVRAGFVPGEASLHRHPLVPLSDPRTVRFVASVADGPSRFVLVHGAPVAILLATGHRVADAYGVRNVSPYTGLDSIHTREQVDGVVEALRGAGGNTIVLPATFDQPGNGSQPPVPVDPGLLARLGQQGFAVVTPQGLRPYSARRGLTGAVHVPWLGGTLVKLVDTRHLRPRALG